METTLQNRNESYMQTIEDGTVEIQHKVILKALWKYGGMTNRQLRGKTNIAINAMSGRLSELQGKSKRYTIDFIIVTGKKYDHISKRNVSVFDINPEPKLF